MKNNWKRQFLQEDGTEQATIYKQILFPRRKLFDN
jgi:hypothetical protein